MIIYLKLISLYFSPMYSLESYHDYKYADGNNEIKIVVACFRCGDLP